MSDVTILFAEVIALAVGVMAFTLFYVNAVEVLGRQVGLSDTAAGSILASLGTATPETLVPVIAILVVGGTGGHDVGVGAILGAPFMLTTIALFVVGITATIGVLTGRRSSPVLDLESGIIRNFKFFFVFYPLAIIAAILKIQMLNKILAILLVLGYAYYVYITIKTPGEEHEEEEESELWLSKIFRKESRALSVFQLVVAFIIMVLLIKMFTERLDELAHHLGISTVLLSLVIAPLATELPEVGGASAFWTWRRKDTLALGNITGAMVYQSSIAVAIGLLLTEWILEPTVAVTVVLALLSAGIVFIWYAMKKELNAYTALIAGVFYFAFLYYAFTLA
ncbi:MAG: cation:H+ antiporter [Archaeoglobi archaeon]|nr:cation:H+ antiporter [Archaeoglobi archaeon]